MNDPDTNFSYGDAWMTISEWHGPLLPALAQSHPTRSHLPRPFAREAQRAHSQNHNRIRTRTFMRKRRRPGPQATLEYSNMTPNQSKAHRLTEKKQSFTLRSSRLAHSPGQIVNSYTDSAFGGKGTDGSHRQRTNTCSTWTQRGADVTVRPFLPAPESPFHPPFPTIDTREPSA
jgi:hypothetical protein